MNAVTNTYVHAAQVPAHPFRSIAVFCALALGAYACVATYGLDLSLGFF